MLVRPADVRAQIQMPDAREMSGIPRPDGAQAAGTVSVRVIRGTLANNIPNQPVELLVNGETRTARTGEDGRAQFTGFPAGATLKAVTVVDGERIESQEFPAPGSPGIRLMLVATDKEKAAREEAAAKAPAVAGEVIIGGESRIVIEPDDEAVRVYYLMDIRNDAKTPVMPSRPFEFDVPTGAVSTAVMDGSSPTATVNENRVRVQGPFAPGSTFLQVGFVLPTPAGSADITQVLPATLEHLAVIVQKVGDARLSSPQIARQQEMPASGQLFIAAAGEGSIAAGTPIVLNVTGLPHHSSAPRWIALGLAIGIVVIGVIAALRPGASAADNAAADRKQLIARREKLLQDLVRLEKDRRAGRGDESRYAARREELVRALEEVYGALDSDDAGPEPARRAGLAA
jgi:hypothetical protein